jgi:CCR4-NOT transcription complex subunit 6
MMFLTESSGKEDNSKHGDPNDPRVRLKRDCVGLLAAFKLTDPCEHILIVANTHIYWQVKFPMFSDCFFAFRVVLIVTHLFSFVLYFLGGS